MPSTMIALASRERMQNIIPVLQKGAAFKKVLLVASTDADKPQSDLGLSLDHTMRILAFFEIMAEKAVPSVDAYAIRPTQELVRTLIERESPSVVVNFTGATKCIAIGAFMAAKETGVKAFYVDTANERLLWFHPDGRMEEAPFDLEGRLTIGVYFQSYGRPIDEKRTAEHEFSAKDFALAEELLAFWPGCLSVLNTFGDAQSQNRIEIDVGGLDHQIIGFLKVQGYINGDRIVKITNQGKQLLQKGKLLEAMTAVLLKRSGYFDDIRTNLYLQGVKNELDVVVIRNGQVAVLECKAGAIGGEELLNKLRSHQSTLGAFTRIFFVAARPEHEIPEHFRERAGMYGIKCIFTVENFLRLPEILRERMRGIP